MAKVSLSPFTCPECKDGTLVKVDVDEDSIKKAKRLPAMVTTSCSKNHTLVLFVDGQFKIRDVEAALGTSGEDDGKKDAIEKTEDWFSSL
ncbi:MAG: hypothetical protein ACFFE2_00405 [Candidatus Thorarchaeota archaeon]